MYTEPQRIRGAGFLGWCVVMPAVIGLASMAVAQPTWDAKWEKTLAEAKKEGRVEVYGGYNPDHRKTLAVFEKRYPWVRLGFTPGGGAQHATRILSERRVGKYLADVVMGGASTFQSYPEGTFEPLRALLILPEVTDKSAWWGGDLAFIDAKAQYVLSAIGSAGIHRIAYNTRLVNPDEIRAWRDLLNPKWRGKILRLERPGAVSDTLVFFYHNPGLGPEFISRLFGAAEIVQTQNLRQGVNWLAEGKFPLYFDSSPQAIIEGQKRGLPVDFLPHSLKEGEIIGGSYCCMGVLTQASHPSAAKIFINWLLSREGQIAWQKNAEINSLRMDVPKEGVPPEQVLKEGGSYFHVNQAKYHQPKDLKTILKIVDEALKSRK